MSSIANSAAVSRYPAATIRKIRKTCRKAGRHVVSTPAICGAVPTATPIPVPRSAKKARWGAFIRRETGESAAWRRRRIRTTTEMRMDTRRPTARPRPA